MVEVTKDQFFEAIGSLPGTSTGANWNNVDGIMRWEVRRWVGHYQLVAYSETFYNSDVYPHQVRYYISDELTPSPLL